MLEENGADTTGDPDDAADFATVDVASWRAAYADIMPAAYLDALSVDEKTQKWAESIPREEWRRKRTFIVEDDDGEIVGFATVGPDVDEPAGLLYLMYVAPHAWGRGAGFALLIAARDALMELGFTKAVLWVLESNARARRFYERDGWLPDGRTAVNDYGGAGLTALQYAIALTADSS